MSISIFIKNNYPNDKRTMSNFPHSREIFLLTLDFEQLHYFASLQHYTYYIYTSMHNSFSLHLSRFHFILMFIIHNPLRFYLSKSSSHTTTRYEKAFSSRIFTPYTVGPEYLYLHSPFPNTTITFTVTIII